MWERLACSMQVEWWGKFTLIQSLDHPSQRWIDRSNVSPPPEQVSCRFNVSKQTFPSHSWRYHSDWWANQLDGSRSLFDRWSCSDAKIRRSKLIDPIVEFDESWRIGPTTDRTSKVDPTAKPIHSWPKVEWQSWIGVTIPFTPTPSVHLTRSTQLGHFVNRLGSIIQTRIAHLTVWILSTD